METCVRATGMEQQRITTGYGGGNLGERLGRSSKHPSPRSRSMPRSHTGAKPPMSPQSPRARTLNHPRMDSKPPSGCKEVTKPLTKSNVTVHDKIWSDLKGAFALGEKKTELELQLSPPCKRIGNKWKDNFQRQSSSINEGWSDCDSSSSQDTQILACTDTCQLKDVKDNDVNKDKYRAMMRGKKTEEQDANKKDRKKSDQIIKNKKKDDSQPDRISDSEVTVHVSYPQKFHTLDSLRGRKSDSGMTTSTLSQSTSSPSLSDPSACSSSVMPNSFSVRDIQGELRSRGRRSLNRQDAIEGNQQAGVRVVSSPLCQAAPASPGVLRKAGIICVQKNQGEEEEEDKDDGYESPTTCAGNSFKFNFPAVKHPVSISNGNKSNKFRSQSDILEDKNKQVSERVTIPNHSGSTSNADKCELPSDIDGSGLGKHESSHPRVVKEIQILSTAPQVVEHGAQSPAANAATQASELLANKKLRNNSESRSQQPVTQRNVAAAAQLQKQQGLVRVKHSETENNKLKYDTAADRCHQGHGQGEGQTRTPRFEDAKKVELLCREDEKDQESQECRNVQEVLHKPLAQSTTSATVRKEIESRRGLSDKDKSPGNGITAMGRQDKERASSTDREVGTESPKALPVVKPLAALAITLPRKYVSPVSRAGQASSLLEAYGTGTSRFSSSRESTSAVASLPVIFDAKLARCGSGVAESSSPGISQQCHSSESNSLSHTADGNSTNNRQQQQPPPGDKEEETDKDTTPQRDYKQNTSSRYAAATTASGCLNDKNSVAVVVDTVSTIGKEEVGMVEDSSCGSTCGSGSTVVCNSSGSRGGGDVQVQKSVIDSDWKYAAADGCTVVNTSPKQTTYNQYYPVEMTEAHTPGWSLGRGRWIETDLDNPTNTNTENNNNNKGVLGSRPTTYSPPPSSSSSSPSLAATDVYPASQSVAPTVGGYIQPTITQSYVTATQTATQQQQQQQQQQPRAMHSMGSQQHQQYEHTTADVRGNEGSRHNNNNTPQVPDIGNNSGNNSGQLYYNSSGSYTTTPPTVGAPFTGRKSTPESYPFYPPSSNENAQGSTSTSTNDVAGSVVVVSGVRPLELQPPRLAPSIAINDRGADAQTQPQHVTHEGRFPHPSSINHPPTHREERAADGGDGDRWETPEQSRRGEYSSSSNNNSSSSSSSNRSINPANPANLSFNANVLSSDGGSLNSAQVSYGSKAGAGVGEGHGGESGFNLRVGVGGSGGSQEIINSEKKQKLSPGMRENVKSDRAVEKTNQTVTNEGDEPTEGSPEDVVQMSENVKRVRFRLNSKNEDIVESSSGKPEKSAYEKLFGHRFKKEKVKLTKPKASILVAPKQDKDFVIKDTKAVVHSEDTKNVTAKEDALPVSEDREERSKKDTTVSDSKIEKTVEATEEKVHEPPSVVISASASNEAHKDQDSDNDNEQYINSAKTRLIMDRLASLQHSNLATKYVASPLLNRHLLNPSPDPSSRSSSPHSPDVTTLPHEPQSEVGHNALGDSAQSHNVPYEAQPVNSVLKGTVSTGNTNIARHGYLQRTAGNSDTFPSATNPNIRPVYLGDNPGADLGSSSDLNRPVNLYDHHHQQQREALQKDNKPKFASTADIFKMMDIGRRNPNHAASSNTNTSNYSDNTYPYV